MKLISEKPKGHRMYKSIKFNHGKLKKVKRPLHIEPVDCGWWFVYSIGQWRRDCSKPCSSSYYSNTHHGFKSVYSVKAAKRLIKKWDLPKGTRIRISLPFVGYNFYTTKQ